VRYGAVIEHEGSHTLASFPDCPGCQTFAKPGDDIGPIAKEAVEGWLESCLADGSVPPRPSRSFGFSRGATLLWVEVSPDLSLKLQIRLARDARGLSQAEVARRAGISQQMVAKLESPDYHPRLDALEGLARALGMVINVTLARDLNAARARAKSRAGGRHAMLKKPTHDRDRQTLGSKQKVRAKKT
jgi:transcriptional regulator with XRE-family HTH domain/predicted RNase H-like HicB family nuclease